MDHNSPASSQSLEKPCQSKMSSPQSLLPTLEQPHNEDTQNRGLSKLSSTDGNVQKLRTKSIRNAGGVLIRKDGWLDRLSHSSTENLRRIHVLKQERRLWRLEAAENSGSHPHDIETRGTSASSTPGPHPLSHRPSEGGHGDDHDEHDEHDLKSEVMENHRGYSQDAERQYTALLNECKETVDVQERTYTHSEQGGQESGAEAGSLNQIIGQLIPQEVSEVMSTVLRKYSYRDLHHWLKIDRRNGRTHHSAVAAILSLP
jgi:hypothetical protein